LGEKKVASFAMVMSTSVLVEGQKRIFGRMRTETAGLAGALSEDRVDAGGHIAAKTWLAHSRTQGIARDPATGSWLACVGNPWGAGTAEVPPERTSPFLLEGYIARGRTAITELNAPFVVVIFDGRDRTTHIVTDRGGFEHIYRRDIGGAQYFATSSLALAGAAEATLDAEAVSAYFRAGYVLGQDTLFKEVRKVGAARWITASASGVKEEKYWEPPLPSEKERDWRGWGREIAEAGVEALDGALSAGVTTTVELTGGMDSRFNFACAVKTGRPIIAWTIGDVDLKDLKVAETLARRARRPHVIVSPLADIAERFEEDFRLIHKLIDGESDCMNVIASPSANRQSARVRIQSVSGVGGERFRGIYYRWRGGDGVNVAGLVDWRLCLGTGYRGEIFRDEYADASGGKMKRRVGEYFDAAGDGPAEWKLEKFYLERPLQGAGGRSVSFNNYFYRPAVPFFSNRMLDLALRMPGEAKRTGLSMREGIRLIDAGLADVPLGTGLPARPLGILDAPRVLAGKAIYARKAARKAVAKLLHVTAAKGASRGFDAVVKDRLAAMCRKELKADEMASAAIYDGGALARFIERSIIAGMPNTTQMGLIMSLELTCRRVGGVRA
jgi:asparagine synthase (glutamine-hydrolysing)